MRKSRFLLPVLLSLFFLRAEAQITGDICSNPAIATLCSNSTFTANVPSFTNNVSSWLIGSKTIKAQGQEIYYELDIPNTGYQTVSVSALLAGKYGGAGGFGNKIYFLWFEGDPCNTNPVEIDSADISGNSQLKDSISFTHNVIANLSQYYLVIDFSNFDGYGYQYSLNLGFTDDQVTTPTCSVAPAPYKKAMTLDNSGCYTSATPYNLPLSSLNDQFSFPNILFPRTLNQTLNYLPVNDDNGYGFILSLKNTDALDTETYHSFNSYPYNHAPAETYPGGIATPSNYEVAITVFMKNNGGAQGLKGFRIQVPDADRGVDHSGFASPDGNRFYNTVGGWNVKYEPDGRTITWLFSSPNGRGDNKTDTGYSCKIYTFDVAVIGLNDTIKAWYLPDDYGNDSLECTTSGRTDCGGAGVITYQSPNANWIQLGATGGGGSVLTGQTCGTVISCTPGAHLIYPCSNGTDNYIYTPQDNCGHSRRFNFSDPTAPIITYDADGCKTEIDPNWFDEFPSVAFADYTGDLYGVDTATICKGQTYQLPMTGGFSGTAPAVLVYVDENAFGTLRPVEADGTIDFNKDVNQIFGYPQPSPGGWPLYPSGSFMVPITKAGYYQLVYGFFDIDSVPPYGTNYYGYNFGCQTYLLIVDTPAITLTPLSPVNLCSGKNINITTTGAVNYSWLPSGSIVSSNSNGATAKPVVTTTYTITGTDNNGCIDTAQYIINVTNCDPPVAKFISPDTGCLAQCVTFIDSSTGNPTSWQWTFDGGSPSSYNGQTPPPVCYNVAGTYTVQLVTADTSGADTTTKTIVIRNCFGAIADFISPDSVCLGNACLQYFDNSLNSPTSWQWVFQGGFPSSYNGQTPPLVCYSLPGTYNIQLTVSNINGGDDTKNKTIRILDCSLPVAGFTTTDTICNSQCIIITDTTSSTATSWQWTFNGGNPSSYSGPTPPQVCYAAAGTYAIQLVATNSYGSDTAVNNIIVNDCSPVAAFASLDTVCIPSCISYTDTSSGKPTSWRWTFNGGNPSSFLGKFPPQVCYSDTGKFQTQLIVNNTYGSDTIIKIITVKDCTLPVAGFTFSDTVCMGQCATFTDTSTGNPASWQWTFIGGNPSSFNGQFPPQICYFDEGHYTARLVVTNNNGTNTLIKTVIVKDCTPPTSSFNAPDNSCRNQCISYTDASQGTPASWIWTFEGGAPSSFNGQTPPQVCYNSAGIYQTTLITSNSNGSDTLVKFITVEDCSPTANFGSTDTTCKSRCVIYTDSSTGNVTSWHWTFNGASPSTFSGSTPPQVCYGDTGTFQTILIVNNIYGSDTLVKTLTVEDCVPPNASFVVAQDTICYGECINVTNTTTGATDNHWTFIGGSTTFFHGEQPPTICYTDSGHFLVKLIASNKFGNDTSILRVIVKNCTALIANFLVNDTICKVNCVNYTNVSSANGKTWKWSFPGGKPSSYTGKTPPLICYDSIGTFTSKLVVSNSLQSDSVTKTVTIVDCSNVASFTTNNNNICTGECITITNNSSSSDTAWHWNFPGATPSSYSGQFPSQVCYSSAGNYIIQLIAYNQYGYASMSQPVKVTDCPPEADFSAAPTSICENNCIHFSNLSSSNSTSWQWTFNGGSPSTYTGETPPEICYSAGGKYDVTLIVSSSSGADTSFRKDYITVREAPDPHISQSKDTLICSPQSNYQWYYSNQIITGATNRFYVAHQDGLYTVKVADNSDCVGVDSIQFIETGTGTIENESGFIISPNPSEGNFQVAGFKLQDETIEVFNMLGEKIDAILRTQNAKLITIDLSSQPDGVYFVRVQTGNGIITRKVEVIH